jgi:hypothetical protein
MDGYLDHLVGRIVAGSFDTLLLLHQKEPKVTCRKTSGYV